jgi:membrane protein implicated in regulation of membrane protease activity
MPVFVRYWLFQVPGILLLGVILWLFVRHGWIGIRLGLLVLGIWILKDALLYPLYRPALQDSPPSGAEALIGEEGILRTDITRRRRGLVEVRGERWRARCEDGRALSAGTWVRVVHARGMVLVVTPAREDAG